MSGDQPDNKIEKEVADEPVSDKVADIVNTNATKGKDAPSDARADDATDKKDEDRRDRDRSRDRDRRRRSRSRSRDRRRRRSRSRSRDRRRRSRSRSRDRRRRSRSRDRRRYRSRSRDRRRRRSRSDDRYGYVPRRRHDAGEVPEIEDPYAKLRQIAQPSADPAEIARQMQEQQLKARQVVLTQQAASAIAAAHKAMRDVYVGNLIPGVVTEDMISQLFNSAMRAAFPDALGPDEEPVVQVKMKQPDGRFCFMELATEEMAAQCVALNQQIPLMGQNLSIGRPHGYADPAKAWAAAQAAADALAKFQADSNSVRKANGVEVDENEPTCYLCIQGMVTAQVLADNQEYEDVIADVKEEFEKFGTVLRVVAPRPTNTEMVGELFGMGPVGKVYVQYLESESAVKAKEAVDGRLFDGRTLEVVSLQPSEYINAIEQEL